MTSWEIAFKTFSSTSHYWHEWWNTRPMLITASVRFVSRTSYRFRSDKVSKFTHTMYFYEIIMLLSACTCVKLSLIFMCMLWNTAEQKCALHQVGWTLTCWADNRRLDLNDHPSISMHYTRAAQWQYRLQLSHSIGWCGEHSEREIFTGFAKPGRKQCNHALT